MAHRKIGKKTKNLESSMVVQSGKTGTHKIGPRSNPGLLDVSDLDPQRNPGTNKEAMLYVSLVMHLKLFCLTLGQLGKPRKDKIPRRVGSKTY